MRSGSRALSSPELHPVPGDELNAGRFRGADGDTVVELSSALDL